MSKKVLVNNVDHKDVRIITDRSARYGDAVMFTLAFPFEFRNIQSVYPILFHRKDNGDYYPVALFGFQEGENLFLDERGWNAAYVPAMIRRDPFLIGYKKVASDAGETDLRMLSLDLDNPRVNYQKGEPLFQPLGGRTPFLESAALLVERIYEGLGHSERFVQALLSQDLIESVTMEIRLNDGSINQLLGFHTINEERLQQLPGNVLEDFSRNGYLMPLFMVIASMANVQRLVELKNAAVAAGR